VAPPGSHPTLTPAPSSPTGGPGFSSARHAGSRGLDGGGGLGGGVASGAGGGVLAGLGRAGVAEARRLAPLYLYRAGAQVARALPGSLGIAAAEAVGVAAGRLTTGRRAMITRHLSRIAASSAGPTGSGVSPVSAVSSGSAASARSARSSVSSADVDRAFASYGRYWLESFRLAHLDGAGLEAGMSYEGIGYLEEARALGRGVIMGMPHLGAWDWGGAWLSASGFPLTVVAEALEPVELFEWFAGWRRQLGMTVVPLDRAAGSAVMAALRRGEVAGLLCDRDLTGDGVEVSFFGERTRLPGGPATLALRTGAPLLPCCVLFDGQQHRGIVRPPLDTSRQGGLREDVQRVTQDLADALAALIRLAPDQWHVFTPNWPSDG